MPVKRRPNAAALEWFRVYRACLAALTCVGRADALGSDDGAALELAVAGLWLQRAREELARVRD